MAPRNEWKTWLEDRLVPFVRAHRRVVLAVLSLVGGTAYTTSIIGFRSLDVTDVSWLGSDAITEYLGWTFMRQDPVTALPLTLTDRIGYPLVISVAHLDVVPLVAIALLPVSRLLPSEFQYFGPLQCLCAAALFYWGHELARLYCKSKVARLAAGTLLMTNSVFTMRLGFHSALTAQFFLVWLLYESAKRFGRAAPTTESHAVWRRSGLVLTLCGLMVALGFNPYVALMTTFFVAAYAVNLVLAERRSVRFVIIVGAVGAVTLAVGSWFFGYVGRHTEDISGSGFGLYSANLNALVNPLGFSRFFRTMGFLTREQIEGSAYLGVAATVGSASAIVAAVRSGDFRKRLRPLLPACCAALLAFVFSLSHRISLGSRLLVEIPLPRGALDWLSVFRTSGRFTWPLFYFAFAATIAAVGLLLPRRAQGICAIALAAVQWMELAPLRTAVRSIVTSNPVAPASLKSEAFLRLGENHEHLVVLPAWQCAPLRSPGGANGYAIFGLIAARQRMTVNSYYSSRYNERSIRVHCRDLPAEVFQYGPRADTAYVLDTEGRAWFEAIARATHECGAREGFHLCVRRGTLY